jgi:hypothetical protein
MRSAFRALAALLAAAATVSACTGDDVAPTTTTAELFAADFEPITVLRRRRRWPVLLGG